MKGKHGQAAAVRQEVQSRDAEIQTYRSAVARLTAELRQVKDQIRAEEQRHRKVERELRARVEEAASPKVAALNLTIEQQQRAVETAKRDAERFERRAVKVTRRYVRHLVNDDHLTFDEAISIVAGPIMQEETGGQVVGEAEKHAIESDADDDALLAARRLDAINAKKWDSNMRLNSTAR